MYIIEMEETVQYSAHLLSVRANKDFIQRIKVGIFYNDSILPQVCFINILKYNALV